MQATHEPCVHDTGAQRSKASKLCARVCETLVQEAKCANGWPFQALPCQLFSTRRGDRGRPTYLLPLLPCRWRGTYFSEVDNIASTHLYIPFLPEAQPGCWSMLGGTPAVLAFIQQRGACSCSLRCAFRDTAAFRAAVLLARPVVLAAGSCSVAQQDHGHILPKWRCR